MGKNVINIAAGPTKIPQSVKNKIATRITRNNKSILELSHRDTEFKELLTKTKSNISELLNVPSDYSILFVNGGASSQFSNIVMNFVPYCYHGIKNFQEQAVYFVTGYWSEKACEEAKRLGVNVLSYNLRDNESENTIFHVPNSVNYVHYCDNETIGGIEFSRIPLLDRKTNVICDMSSSILSKEINIREYSMIYASAQKLLGIAGVTLVIICNEFLYKCSVNKYSSQIPKMMDYEMYQMMDSCYNTPPIIAIYTMYEMTVWNLKNKKKIVRENFKKSKKLYATIIKSRIFTCNKKNCKDIGKHCKDIGKHCKDIATHCNLLGYSRMNVIFDLDERYKHLKHLFEEFMQKQRIQGFHGHSSVGGYRISCYNQIRLWEIKCVVNALQDFEYVFS
jgi:phosphoserine aminotransferase